MNNDSGFALSKRLSALLSWVTSCGALVDVGCDHAYVSIEAVLQGRAVRAYATDLREGPLRIAEENIRQVGLQERVSCLKADGIPEELATLLDPSERNLLLISGMGADLMIRILKEGQDRHLLRFFEELILSPQSDWMSFRLSLQDLGFEIVDEMLLEEEGKTYLLLKARPGSGALSETEAYAGPRILQKRDPLLPVYLEKRKKTISDIRAEIEAHAGEGAKERLNELDKERMLIDETESVMRDH